MNKQVNLLPPSEQRFVRQAGLNRQLFNFGAWLTVSLVIVALIFLAVSLILRAELSASRALIQVKTEELDKLEQDFLQGEVVILNQDLENFEKVLKENKMWSGVLREVAALLPKDMVLDSLVIDAKENKVAAKGRTGTRSSVLSYRQNLLDSEYFQSVNFPLANLEEAFGGTWEYGFFVNPKILETNKSGGDG